MNAIQALAVAKSYTDSEIAGAGAIKGAPCQIQSITDITGGHRVTFLWVDNEEVSHTSTLDVMDGEKGDDGVGIASITFKEKDASGNNVYTVTMTDGTTYDITCPKGDKGDEGEGIIAGGTTGQVLAKKSNTDYDTEWKTVNADLPTLFDERETEYQVGWYVLANGTKKPLYEKNVDCGALPNASEKNVAHNITNLGKVIDIRGYSYNGTSYMSVPLVYEQAYIQNTVRVSVAGEYVKLITSNDRTSFVETYVTLRYTKTTDTPE